MKRFFITALALVTLVGGTLTPSCAPASAAQECINYFSVSLVNPKTRALTPIKIYYNGHLTLDRKIHIPHGSTFYVKLIAPKGRYISAVFRDDTDTQYDLPRRARFIDRDTKEFMWTMPRRFVSGNVEFFVSLYATMNQETGSMGEYTIERTGWITLGETQI